MVLLWFGLPIISASTQKGHHHQGLLLGYLRREKGCGKPVDDTM